MAAGSGPVAGLALWLTRGAIQLDTDSAMRLVQVRDLLHGQSWFDTIQHRMNTPYGLAMHWSRLVDAPLALLMRVEIRCLIAWPLLLFAAVLLLLARIAFALSGKNAILPVVALGLLCSGVYASFAPGNIDHHGLQLVLMLAALLGVIERRPVLGAAAALGLGVGLESLPYAVVAIRILCARPGEGAQFRRDPGWHRCPLLLLANTTAGVYPSRRCATPIHCSMRRCW
ncbi:MAG: hypothetical protein U1E93_12720 [Alphaproteobacteria bacterium]